MIRQQISKRKQWFLTIVTVLVILGGYSGLSAYQKHKNPKSTTIPSLVEMGQGLSKAVTPHHRSGERWLVVDFQATMTRLFTGLAIGAFIGVSLGVLMGCFRSVESAIGPIMVLCSKIPPTAAMAIFFALLGTELKMYAGIIIAGIVPTLSLSIALAVKDVPEQLIFKIYTIGASHCEAILDAVVKPILPKIIDAIRLTIGPAMIFIIPAEMLVSDVGLGYRIRIEARLLHMDVVYPYLILLAMFGFFMDFILRDIQNLICPSENVDNKGFMRNAYIMGKKVFGGSHA